MTRRPSRAVALSQRAWTTKAFARKTRPTLRDHLKQAQDLQAKLSTSTQ